MEQQVGIKELKEHLSLYLRRAKEGECITVTHRGVPIARLSPLTIRVPAGIQRLVDAGLASWPGTRPEPGPPVEKVRGSLRQVADLVSEER